MTSDDTTPDPPGAITLLDVQRAALRLCGLRCKASDGHLLGRIEAVLVDRDSGAVRWLHLRLPGLTLAHAAVPLEGFRVVDGSLSLSVEAEAVAEAPRVPASGRLTPRLERQLCECYSLSSPGAQRASWERRVATSRLVAPGTWEPGPRTDEPAPPTHPARRAISRRRGRGAASEPR